MGSTFPHFPSSLAARGLQISLHRHLSGSTQAVGGGRGFSTLRHCHYESVRARKPSLHDRTYGYCTTLLLEEADETRKEGQGTVQNSRIVLAQTAEDAPTTTRIRISCSLRSTATRSSPRLNGQSGLGSGWAGALKYAESYCRPVCNTRQSVMYSTFS